MRERQGIASDIRLLQFGPGIGDLVRHHAISEKVSPRRS
jgi:hypothetical protein